jgi:hypothetical protein
VEKTEAERLREMPLDAVAQQAIDTYTGSPGRRAEIELERRLIVESIRVSRRLKIATAESIRVSRRLEVATWVIAALTAALIGIAVLEIVGVLGN